MADHHARIILSIRRSTTGVSITTTIELACRRKEQDRELASHGAGPAAENGRPAAIPGPGPWTGPDGGHQVRPRIRGHGRARRPAHRAAGCRRDALGGGERAGRPRPAGDRRGLQRWGRHGDGRRVQPGRRRRPSRPGQQRRHQPGHRRHPDRRARRPHHHRVRRRPGGGAVLRRRPAGGAGRDQDNRGRGAGGHGAGRGRTAGGQDGRGGHPRGGDGGARVGRDHARRPRRPGAGSGALQRRRRARRRQGHGWRCPHGRDGEAGEGQGGGGRGRGEGFAGGDVQRRRSADQGRRGRRRGVHGGEAQPSRRRRRVNQLSPVLLWYHCALH